MKAILEKLFQHQSLSQEEAYGILTRISRDEFSEEQKAAFLTVFNMRKITVDELLGFKNCLLDLSVKVDLGAYPDEAIDIVGTGGDGKDTFNISTLSTFIVAGTGKKVIKHGNYSSSSVSGSSHMLEYFGYGFTHDSDQLKRYLDQTNICFLHAPLFHPAMKYVGAVRKALKVKTFFNIMGPLVNPAQPKYQLLGTFNVATARLYHLTLQGSDRHYTVVHSLDGYDEVSLTSDTKIFRTTKECLLEPKDFGFEKISQASLYGGEQVKDNAKIFKSILEGKGTVEQNNVVIANSALALQVFDENLPLMDAVAEAKESLESKKALDVFSKLMKISAQ